MSVACFTCSSIAGAVSPMTNPSHWGILCSLLLPDQNIEHVCFPNPNLNLCAKCIETLHSISEFRNVAINSVRTMLENWNCEMNPLGCPPCSVQVKFDNVGIKQEVMDEDTICDRVNNAADLHEEITKPEANREDVTEPEDTSKSQKTLTKARKAKKKSGLHKQPDLPPNKKKKKYNTKKISTKELEAYRSQWLGSEEFREARHKCTSCLLVFDTRSGQAEHRDKCHSKKPHLQECIVCKQTMISVAIAKHIASHFELVECKKCGHLTHDANTMKQHRCGNDSIYYCI